MNPGDRTGVTRILESSITEETTGRNGQDPHIVHLPNLGFVGEGKVLRVLPSGRLVPRNQGRLNL